MENFLDELNEIQKEAATTVDGPVLILAGAGSGKTRVLTYRIAHLIAKGIRPENILAVTFTNKAAGEMKERIKKLLEKNSRSPEIKMPLCGTFHAICVRILRQEIASPLPFYERAGLATTDSGRPSADFGIYDEQDQIGLIKEAMEELEISREQFNPASALAEISRAKSELVDENDYARKTNGFWQETVAKIYRLYQKKLNENNALDFDDLIMMTVKIFQLRPEILEKYQNRFRYISVDEYQDTNYAQYILIRLLAEKYRNLCVVGDDWQSIYAFRGADFRNILNFERDWPEAKVVTLVENYRSTQNILDAAHEIIVKNKYRKEKRLWTKNPRGSPIFVIQTASEKAEADFIVEKIREQRQNFKNFTVLYRTNAQSRAIEEAFLRAGFPYKIIGGVKFYQRKEIKDILAYLKFVLNPLDSASLNRIIGAPARGIGKNGALLLAQTIKNNPAADFASLDFDDSKAGRNLKNFCGFLSLAKKSIKNQNLGSVLKFLIKESGYEKYLLENQRDGQSRLENLLELLTVAEKYDELEPAEGIRLFLEESALLADADEVEDKKNVVNLMTLHAAKGLEFSTVFIAGCEEGLFPHSRSVLKPEEMEEERRLAYVGITRAKKEVYLIFSKRRRIYGNIQVNPPSRFLADIPAELASFHDFSAEDTEEEYEDFENNIVRIDDENF
ncbi:MAG: UvrD-helicase domain-containing protein [bacterium]|nr:UvrD-helicase domain-containing protein [bacterium]